MAQSDACWTADQEVGVQFPSGQGIFFHGD